MYKEVISMKTKGDVTASRFLISKEMNKPIPEDGYLGDATSKACGNAVKNMVKSYEERLIDKR